MPEFQNRLANPSLVAYRKQMAGKKISRFFKLFGMTASVASQFAGYRIAEAFLSADRVKQRREDTHAFAGNRIAKTLGELKGPVMKAGQMASIWTELLPKEISGPLTSLRKDAPPIDFDIIALQIEKELGAPPSSLFKTFEAQPFAAASIGQVHKAVTAQGETVAVKVQYPGVDTSCDADLRHLAFALKASGLFKNRKQVFERFFSEMKKQIHSELDYCNEAFNLNNFRKFHRCHPYIRIPEVFPEYSTQRVLTMNYEPGDRLLAAKEYPSEVKNLIGERLVRLFFSQFFEFGQVHTDPNPANFAFSKNGDICVFDFGNVKQVSEEQKIAGANIFKGAFEQEYDLIESGMIGLGARDLDGPEPLPEMYRTWRNLLIPIFNPDEPFDFGTATIHSQVIAKLPEFVKYVPAFKLPVELMFLQRTLVGLYGNLKALGAIVPCRQVINDILENNPLGESSHCENQNSRES